MMILFKSRRIKYLESELRYEKEFIRDLRDQLNKLQLDMALLHQYLNVSIETVNTRRVVSKGGPERGE